MESGARANEARHGVHLDIAAYGDISSLFWAHNPAPPAEHVVCDVAFGETPYSLVLGAFGGVGYVLHLFCVNVYPERSTATPLWTQKEFNSFL